MGIRGAGTAPSRRLPPRPESAAAARRFVRDVLAEAPPDLVDTAQLLVSELVTNAVVHAHTDVEVRAWAFDGRVRVDVSDHQPCRAPVPHQGGAYASTGRGLVMVEELASCHGVDVGEDRKTVWFELRAGADTSDTTEPSTPSGWGAAAAPSAPCLTVRLIDLPSWLHAAAQLHREALLRESILTAFVGEQPIAGLEDLLTAQDANHLINACLDAASEQHAPGAQPSTLRVSIPADATPAVLTLRTMLGVAQEAARRGRLLTRPALPQIRAATHWLLEEITGQLAGEAPKAWTSAPRGPEAIPPESAPYDTSSLESTSIPTIAADDSNRIIAVNAPAADLLGWDADDLVGRRITALVPEHLRERHIAGFTSLLLTGESRILGRSVPMQALHRDGRLIPVSLLIRTQESNDGRCLFVATLTPGQH
jgi:PAS domain S-box-containing protein